MNTVQSPVRLSSSIVTEKYQGTSVTNFFIIGNLKAFYHGLLSLF